MRDPVPQEIGFAEQTCISGFAGNSPSGTSETQYGEGESSHEDRGSLHRFTGVVEHCKGCKRSL